MLYIQKFVPQVKESLSFYLIRKAVSDIRKPLRNALAASHDIAGVTLHHNYSNIFSASCLKTGLFSILILSIHNVFVRLISKSSLK